MPRPRSFDELLGNILGESVRDLHADGESGEDRNRLDEATRAAIPQMRDIFAQGIGNLDPALIGGFLAEGGQIDRGNQQNNARQDFRNVMNLLGQHGFELAGEENKRRDQALGILNKELARGDKEFASENGFIRDTDFSRLADGAGAKAKAGISNLRSLLGARGLGGGSGAAAGLASRIAFQQQSEVIGAKRDTALEAAQRSAIHRARRQQFVGGIANLTNQSPSMIGLDTLTNIFDVRAAGVSRQEEIGAANKAGKRAQTGAILGGVGNIFGAAAGGF